MLQKGWNEEGMILLIKWKASLFTDMVFNALVQDKLLKAVAIKLIKFRWFCVYCKLQAS